MKKQNYAIINYIYAANKFAAAKITEYGSAILSPESLAMKQIAIAYEIDDNEISNNIERNEICGRIYATFLKHVVNQKDFGAFSLFGIHQIESNGNPDGMPIIIELVPAYPSKEYRDAINWNLIYNEKIQYGMGELEFARAFEKGLCNQ